MEIPCQIRQPHEITLIIWGYFPHRTHTFYKFACYDVSTSFVKGGSCRVQNTHR